MQLDKEFWDSRYKQAEIGWDIGAVSTPLKEYFDQLTNKDSKILIPGAGHAYEAEYLFHKGFKNVFVADFSQTALDNFLKRVTTFPRQNTICEDFFLLKGQYNLIIEQTFFCALNPTLRAAYAKQMSKLLVPKGKLVGLLFNIPLNKDKPPFGGCKEEYTTYFTPYFTIKKMETAYNSIHPRKESELFIILEKK
jgi:hypothetical protein